MLFQTAAHHTQTFEANFDEVAPAIVAASPAQHHPAAPASVAPNEQDDDDAQRREFEEGDRSGWHSLKRQRRLPRANRSSACGFVGVAGCPRCRRRRSRATVGHASAYGIGCREGQGKARLERCLSHCEFTSAASVLQSPTSGLETIAELRERAASAATASEALQKNTEKIQLQSPVASLTKTLDGLSTAARAMPSMPISMASLGGSAQNLSLSSLSTSFVDASQWSRLGALSSASNGENDVTVDVSGADAYGEEEEEDSTAARTSAVPSGKSDQPPEKAKKKKTEEERLDAYLAAGKLEKAAQYAANSPKRELRTLATLAKFEAAAPKPAASSDTQQQQQQGASADPALLWRAAKAKWGAHRGGRTRPRSSRRAARAAGAADEMGDGRKIARASLSPISSARRTPLQPSPCTESAALPRRSASSATLSLATSRRYDI